MNYEEKIMRTEKIYEGKLLSLRVDTIELPDKKYSKREIIEHPGSVTIVGITSENEILLVEQFRNAIGKKILELPAGKIEVNEEPRETAIRELREETGYVTEEIEYISEFYTSPGFSNEKILLFLSRNLKVGEDPYKDMDFIKVEKHSIEDLLVMISKGEILDSKTIVGILTIHNYLYK